MRRCLLARILFAPPIFAGHMLIHVVQRRIDRFVEENIVPNMDAELAAIYDMLSDHR